jgi:hypothetical protein
MDEAEELSFPDFVWRENKSRLAIEISIDFIPASFRGRWLPVLQSFTADWVKKNRFLRKATLWMWFTPVSANFLALNGVPSGSEFVVQFGFPERFFEELEVHLGRLFDGRAAFKEYLTTRREDGWAAICHVEGGKAWHEIDADTWAPV